MKNNSTLFISGALLVQVLTGCTVNRTLSYQRLDARTDYPARPTLIAFHDQREAVLTGKEKKTFCGHVNSSAQIAYNVQTQDGLPLSTEFAKALSASMNENGGKTGYLVTEPSWSTDSIISLLVVSRSPRSLLFTMNEWEISGVPLFTSIRYEVRFDMTLQVLDENGVLLATTATHGSKRKEEGMAVSMKKMQAYSQNVLQDVVHELMTKEVVRNVIAYR